MRHLTDVCNIQYGYAFDANQFINQPRSDSVPLVRIRDVVRGFSETYTCEPYADAYRVQDGDILVGMDGEFNIARWHGGEAALNQRVCKLLPHSDVDGQFLLYFMRGALKRIERQTSFVTVKHLSAKRLNQVVFPEVSLQCQQEMATILDGVQAGLSNRQRVLVLLDELVKARFVEMFGDPLLNPRKWEIKRLKDVTTKIGSGATPTGGQKAYHDEGISLIRSMNIYDNDFAYKDLAHIDAEQAEALSNVVVQSEDVLFNITGASVARCAIVPVDVLPARVNQHVAIIRCNIEKLNAIYLNQFLISQAIKETLLRMAEAGGATRQALTRRQLENIEVVVPPLPLQNQFAAFVHQVAASKAAVQAQLAGLTTLRAKLMQDFFG